jgi:predicted acetyltransferase
MKKYRRSGLGRAMADHLFSALPGYWEVGQMTNNLPAQRFWKQVIAEYTGNNYEEHSLSSGWWQGIVQCFHSGTQQ